MAVEIIDERPLSERLADAVPEGERERQSLKIGESANAISRWISGDVVPGPGKYRKIADLLNVPVAEVGAAAALDALARWERKHSR